MAAATAMVQQKSACTEINVGGTIFKVGTNTLRRSAFFASLLSDDFCDDLHDECGRLFIDRDPELFGEVLRLLRGYAARCAPETAFSWGAIKAEADFYQVPMEMLAQPVELVLPPDILFVRRLYLEDPRSYHDQLQQDEMCIYSMRDLPPDLKAQTRIIAVEVIRSGLIAAGSKTVFAIGQRFLEEAGFSEQKDIGCWERTERRCYHRLRPQVELLIPEHPMEICRETHEHYVCVVYCVPLVGAVVATTDGVVGMMHNRRALRARAGSEGVESL